MPTSGPAGLPADSPGVANRGTVRFASQPASLRARNRPHSAVMRMPGQFCGQIHASCVARGEAGVLLLGPPRSGKSDLVLRLLQCGFTLVADDQVQIENGVGRAPFGLAGMLEVRGLGIVSLPYAEQAR